MTDERERDMIKESRNIVKTMNDRELDLLIAYCLMERTQRLVKQLE